ncbi:MAG: alpha-glucan family phosphorylase [Bryobacteraceae bacterium]|nr:alpha-glucan family phosphorylase [Bryobacteraceae bacterium]
MGYQITALKEFVVRPALPPALSRLPELAYNLHWTWEHSLRSLFRRLDPALWRESHNPVLMLNQLSQAVLDKAAADPRYMAAYRKACDLTDAYQKKSEPSPFGELIAYFSMEYGIADCMPIYSGGLGVLSGDHLKAASDAAIPLVACGLLYQKGYLQQSLNPDGWQIERTPINDFFNLPVQPVHAASGEELKVSVKLPTGPLWLKVWMAQVGRITLYLLDSNIPDNENPEHRAITEQLYGGDAHTRIRQEIALGIGGVRTLKALGLSPTVFHMNEGHSAFLALERVRDLMMSAGLSFDEAFEATRVNNVFTTHTSVPAGIDLFDPGTLWDYFRDYCAESGITVQQFFSLGRRHPNDSSERFSMAITAMKISSYRNAVSRLHAEVSQDMWRDLWPDLPVWEVPITSVTNGVHLPTFLNGDLAQLYTQYLQPDWQERYPEPRIWDQIAEIPDDELWQAHRRRKRQLTTFLRERLVEAAYKRKASAAEIKRLETIFDPDVFTIGFARRFATYKRATLLFRDVDRLKKLVTNPQRPVQILIGGKAHPKDTPGKTFIRDIVQLTRDPDLAPHLVFVEDYSIQVAKEMVQGVDVWLNTPRRGEEACGTSGMKAAINGVLNLSILDGWFDEAYETSGGWAIGQRVPYEEDQDAMHASDIYSLLENEILPMYYSGTADHAPKEWVGRMKQCLRAISPQFNAQRMVEEYMGTLYRPAHDAWRAMGAHDYAAARERAGWLRHIERSWDRVRIVESGREIEDTLVSGQPVSMKSVVELNGLKPDDVRVEAVVGRVGATGHLEDTEVIQLMPAGQNHSGTVFAREFVPHQTGRLGFTVRLSPNHFEDPLTRPCNAPMKWS